MRPSTSYREQIFGTCTMQCFIDAIAIAGAFHYSLVDIIDVKKEIDNAGFFATSSRNL